jgi:hypothetical protein
MGNWTRVKITGSMAPEHVAALSNHLAADFMDKRWGCLHNGGICGLPNWAAVTIDALGNLGERDYGPQSIAEELEKMAGIAPSLSAKVHVGSDYEKPECVATVTLADGKATIGPAEIAMIPDLNEGHMMAGLLRQLGRR